MAKSTRKASRSKAVGPRTGGVQASSGDWVPSNYGSGYSVFPISEDSAQRGWRPRLDRDLGKMTTTWRQRAMISDAHYIYGRVGQVSGSIHSKANYAVGQAWAPRYRGNNSR